MAAISVAISMAIAIPLSKVFVREPGMERGVYSYALAFANSGYIGDPIVLALFGEEALAYYKLYCLPLSIVIYTWGNVSEIDRGKGIVAIKPSGVPYEKLVGHVVKTTAQKVGRRIIGKEV